MHESLGRRIASHYRQEFGNPRQERLFISSLTFLGAFGLARAITHAIQHRIGPFHNLSVGGRHVHHLVFGIGGLLTVGYLWLLLIGTERRSAAAARAPSAL